MKEFLWEKAKTLVRNSSGKPVLFTYGSDATPLLTQESAALQPGPKEILYRRAKESGEFLVERAFVLTHGPAGGFQKACLVADPRHLSQGKTALHSFKACTEFSPH